MAWSNQPSKKLTNRYCQMVLENK